SAASRLGGWLLDRFAHTAEAKLSAQYLRSAEITLDGRYLLFGGITVEETPDEVPVDAFVDPVGAGVVVVDLTSMEIAYRDDTKRAFRLSPNGYSVLMWGTADRSMSGDALSVLDLRTIEALELWPTGGVSLASIAPNGRVGYAARGMSGVRTLVAFELE